MLSENLQELLSAYVDGELASAEYSRVMTALRESESAREYVKALRSISSQLKALPEIPSPYDFTKQFLKKQQQIQRVARKRRYITAGMAAAAALVLASAAWLAWNSSNPAGVPNTPAPVLAHNNQPNPGPNRSPNNNIEELPKPLDTTGLMALAKQGAAEIAAGWQQFSERANQSMAWIASAETRRAELALTSSTGFLASPINQAGSAFKTLDIQLPLLVSPSEFNLATLQTRWEKKGLFILDVSSNDTVKTLSRLMEAAKKNGVSLVVDEEVTKRLEKKLPATFMVYLENANEEKLHKVLQNLDQLDRWHDALNAGDMSAQSLFFYALEQDGRVQLAKGLGIRPERLQPITTSTGMKPEEQQGVVLAYYPTRVAESISPDVRKTLEKMPGPKGDNVSVVFLLRQIK
jgi:hypothetical protein